MLTPPAQEIVDRFATYTEVSPSGTGVKLIIRGKKPEEAECKSKAIEGIKEVEIYDHARFFTMTGQRLPGTPAEIADGQAELEALCARLWPPKADHPVRRQTPTEPAVADDQELIDRMFAAKNAEAIRRLWEGDDSAHGGDTSAGDLALCNHLAFWTACDADRMDRLFRVSGRYREKWDRDDYRQWTIGKAIEDCPEVYGQRRSNGGCGGGGNASGDDSNGGGQDDGGIVPLGERDPESGRLVLSPKRTLPTAQAYVREFHRHPQGRTLHHYAGMLMAWRAGRYAEIEDGLVRNRLGPWLHEALKYVVDRKTNEPMLVDFESNPATVRSAFETLAAHCYLEASIESPSWLSGEPLATADELLPCRSKLLHLPTGEEFPATPRFFNVNALDYDPDPDETMPEEWLRFLDQLFGDDDEAVQLLQEWFGYSSQAGENVLDLFGGSGSTLIGCETTGRRAFLMEIDPAYCDVIVKRWEQFTGKKAERVTADAVAEEAA